MRRAKGGEGLGLGEGRELCSDADPPPALSGIFHVS